MTKAQSKRIEILRAKVQAGVPIKESEWLSWQRAPRSTKYEDTRNESEMRRLYLAAIVKDEDDATPNAIYWEAYESMERGETCDLCRRPGWSCTVFSEHLCRPCRSWSETLMGRPRVRRAIGRAS